jgi:hypothetical protein
LRKAVLGIVVVLAAAGCSGVPNYGSQPRPSVVAQGPDESSDKLFSKITVGEVEALVPDGWQSFPSGAPDGLHEGFVATPEPRPWQKMDGSAVGMSATWVDATRVGVPSDFYYLAATGPVLSGLTHSTACRALSLHAFVNNRPTYEAGPPGSPGDYVASGDGTCRVGGRANRWAYYVAAPGFGPVHKIGIPSSGLYVVVVVMHDTTRVVSVMHTLLTHTHFGGAGLKDFIAAGRAI